MQMTVTRALVELKRLDDRINSAISQGVFVGVTVGKDAQRKVVNSHISVSEAENQIKGSFDTVEQLIANRQKIKSAVVLSNAQTKVTVLGREMSVAEAIELKSTITFRTVFANTLKRQSQAAQLAVNDLQTKLDDAIERGVTTLYGSDKSKVDAGAYEAVATPQRNSKQPAVLDPQKISEKIAKVEKEISDLSSEVDFILSESNARTTIEVDI